MADNLKSQLYPTIKDIKDSNNEIEPWIDENKTEELVPDKKDVKHIYSLIKQIIECNRNIDPNSQDEQKLHKITSSIDNDIDSADEEIISILRNIYRGNVDKENITYNECDLKDIKIDIVKGSIYKIKKYYLEDNDLKDIRGGSMIIDYLNISHVREVLQSSGFSEENIIYCGGGNIFLVLPKGYGRRLCEKFESEFTRISITIMSAFETLESNLFELLYDFKKLKIEIEKRVTERTKLKLYDINFDEKYYKCSGIKLEEEYDAIDFDKYLNPNTKAGVEGVCDLCRIRNAEYKIDDEAKKIKVCCSCGRKHIVGKAKSIFVDRYEEYVRKSDKAFKIEKKNFGSIDNIGEEIAVIYGDGNNMGNVVKNISNIFEMMYFSRKTDNAAKNSVYEAFKHSLKSEGKFEIIGLGGDDIFIIVPAEKAFKIAYDIIDNFDKAFGNEITMSIGIAIGKKSTPIKSLADLAQMKLDDAKRRVKEDKNIKQGTIDVIELVGDMHISEKNKNKRLFPLTKDDFKIYINKLNELKNKNEARTQLYKVGYAKENMIKEEFELFYFYQNSKIKSKKDTKSIHDFLKEIESEVKFSDIKPEEPYAIDWNELILIYERGEKLNEESI